MRGGDGVEVGPGEAPGYVYWEHPDSPSDTGWRVLVGDETREEADDPDCWQINRVQTLQTHHRRLRQLLREGVRGEWRWDEQAQRYVPEVADPDAAPY